MHITAVPELHVQSHTRTPQHPLEDVTHALCELIIIISRPCSMQLSKQKWPHSDVALSIKTEGERACVCVLSFLLYLIELRHHELTLHPVCAYLAVNWHKWYFPVFTSHCGSAVYLYHMLTRSPAVLKLNHSAARLK